MLRFQNSPMRGGSEFDFSDFTSTITVLARHSGSFDKSIKHSFQIDFASEKKRVKQ